MAQLLYGDALARSGKYMEALTALNEATRLTPHTALLYDVRGVVGVLAGQAEAAEADFRRALTLDDQFADAYCGLGLLQLRQGMVAAAIASLTRALDLAPEHPAARNARGVAYLHAGDLAQAVEDLTQAARGNPRFHTAVENLQAVQEYQGRLVLPTSMGRGEGIQRNSITLVVADPSQMNTATAWASEMVQDRTGQTPVIVHNPQEARAKASAQPVILQSPVSDLRSVAGDRVLRDLRTMDPQASVNVLTLGDAAADWGTLGLQRYLNTTPRERQSQIASVQLVTPSEVAGLAGKAPLAITDLGTVARRAREIHVTGIPVAVYETEGKLGIQHISNVKAFREAGVDTYTTPWQGSVGMGLGLSPKFPYINPGVKVDNAADSAASHNDSASRDWTVFRGGSEQHVKGSLREFGQEYIGGVRQSPQPGLSFPRGAAGPGGAPSGTPYTYSGSQPQRLAERLPRSTRGGVLMLTEVVDHSPATPLQPPELRATFLLFSALASKR
jgi:hypothetical protein